MNVNTLICIYIIEIHQEDVRMQSWQLGHDYEEIHCSNTLLKRLIYCGKGVKFTESYSIM